jgi:hypothetical protein
MKQPTVTRELRLGLRRTDLMKKPILVVTCNLAMFPILGVMLMSGGFTAFRFANRQS